MVSGGALGWCDEWGCFGVMVGGGGNWSVL